MSRHGLDGKQATVALARLAMVRAVRGKAMWVGLALMILPVATAAVRIGLGHDRAEVWQALFTMILLVLPIIPSILIASSLADELEEKTAAYLWSRALPRWSIVTGKLLGLAPITAAVMMIGATAGWGVVGGPAVIAVEDFLRTLAGLAASAVAAGTIAAAWATLVPRHAVATSMVWLLFVDLPIAALPFKLHFLSSAFAAAAIAGFSGTAPQGLATFIGISVVTTAVAIWRIRRLE